MNTTKRKKIFETLKQRCCHSGIDSRFVKWLYTFKIILCILLGRYTDLDTDPVKGVAKYNFQKVLWHPDPSVFMWSELAVGKGARNWHYTEFLDTTPEGDIGEYNGRIHSVRL